jgi:hypothetical protein
VGVFNKQFADEQRKGAMHPQLEERDATSVNNMAKVK